MVIQSARILFIATLYFCNLVEVWPQSTTESGRETVGSSNDFISRPETVTADDGSRVTLPCQTRHKGVHVVVWKRGRRVLSARNTIVTRDRRFRLGSDYSMEIFPVRPEDNGPYTCQLDTEKLPEITHSLHVLYGPRVSVIPSAGVLLVEKGGSAQMRCNASGQPEPTVRWRRQTGYLPGGVETVSGHVMTLTQVTRSMDGLYECVASNGHGPPAVASMRLQVQFGPEVRVQQSTVSSGVGHLAELTCHVTSDPPAKVEWINDERPVNAASFVSVDEVPHTIRHVLRLASVTAADFGIYKCRAENKLGSATGQMVLSGTPGQCHITSASISLAADRYRLAWQVVSHEPLLEYRVAYQHSQFNSSRHFVMSRWREVLVPVTGSDVINGTVYCQRIPLSGLAAETRYDVQVQARNGHGWGVMSDLFHFTTTTVGQALKSQNAGCASFVCEKCETKCSLYVLTWLTLAAYCWHI